MCFVVLQGKIWTKKRPVGEEGKERDPEECGEKQPDSKNDKPSPNTPYMPHNVLKCSNAVHRLISPQFHESEVNNVVIPVLQMKTPKQRGIKHTCDCKEI